MSAAVLVFGICVVCCVVGHAAILASVIRRRGAVVDASVPRPRLAVEVFWALVPMIALAFLLTATWGHVRNHAGSKPGVMMKIAQ